jgi:WD40-like Beta Propeller Repeat
MVETWCPRCEWFGTAAERRCPACGTPTLAVEETPAADASERVEEARATAGAPAVGADATAAGEPPRAQRSPVGGLRGWPSFGRLAAAAVPVVVVVAVLSSGLTGSGGGRGPLRPPASWATPVTSGSGGDPSALLGAPALPSRLAYVASGQRGGPGGGLQIVEGAGLSAYAPRAGRDAASFMWSPDGSHLAVLNAAGGLRLLPEGVRARGPIRDIAFSPDGRYLAICRGAGRPWIAILEADSQLDTLVSGFHGCDPAWSPDGTYLSYLVPGASEREAGHRFVLNTHLDVRFEIPAAGPLVWAPANQYVLSPVTSLTLDCTSVQAMDPRGGRAHVVASIPFLSKHRPGSAAPCQVTMIAWSPDARWLAVAIRPGPGVPDRVIAFEPRTHVLVPLPVDELGLTPTSLSWSPSGDALLVGGLDATGHPIALEAVPPGVRPSERIDAADASWSPDGAWILGHDGDGWAAFEAVDPTVRVPLSAIPSTALLARWCCPAVDVVRGPEPPEQRPSP